MLWWMLCRGSEIINGVLVNRVQQRKAQEASTVDKIKRRLERIKLRQERLGNIVESTDHYIGWCCCFLTVLLSVTLYWLWTLWMKWIVVSMIVFIFIVLLLKHVLCWMSEHPCPPIDNIWTMMFVWRQVRRLSGLVCFVLCTEAVYSHKHT